MKITGNQFILNSLKNMTQYKKNDFKKNTGFMNRSPSHQVDKMHSSWLESERLLDNLIADRIAKKIARGENVTAEERDKLRGLNAEKLRKADEANMKRKEVGLRLSKAKTKTEASKIILAEKMSAQMIYEKGDQEYGELLMEAVNKAEIDYYKKKQFQPDKFANDKTDNEKRNQLFDVRL